MGQLLLQLACAAGSLPVPSLDFASAHYSPEFVRLLVLLLGVADGGGFSWRAVSALLGERLLLEVDSLAMFNEQLVRRGLVWRRWRHAARQRSAAAASVQAHASTPPALPSLALCCRTRSLPPARQLHALTLEMENGRLFRLMTKLAFVTDRNADSAVALAGGAGWCDTGDRYLLQLFREFVFHQGEREGGRVVDWGHVLEQLNKVRACVRAGVCWGCGVGATGGSVQSPPPPPPPRPVSVLFSCP
jgi:hypothetical protein